MRLLCDSDALCKLTALGLLEPALEVVGSTMAECLRLAALPHMLRRGKKLREMLGENRATAILPLVEGIARAPEASDEWKSRLIDVPQIDPGELQLLALAAEQSLLLVTGDKRALQSVATIPEFPPALRRKVVLFEVVLLELCKKLGDDAVRNAVRAAKLSEVMMKIAFSDDNANPRQALASYIEDARLRFAPLELWQPPPPGGNP